MQSETRSRTCRILLQTEKEVDGCVNNMHLDVKYGIEDGMHCEAFKQELEEKEFKADIHLSESCSGNSNFQEAIDCSSNEAGIPSKYRLQVKNELVFDDSHTELELESIKRDIKRVSNGIDSYESTHCDTKISWDVLKVCDGQTNGGDSKTVFTQFHKSRIHKDKGPSKYKNHIEKGDKTEKDLFQCYLCKLKYTCKSSLKRHINCKHSAEPEWFFCDSCGYRTKRKYFLNIHRKNYCAIGKMYCCQFCDHKTEKESALKEHLNQKHKEIENEGTYLYNCQFCESKYKHKRSLEKHILYKHNENAKWYECSSCDYKSKRKDCLRSHLKMHYANVEVYFCQFCKSEFKYKRTLKRHIDQKHNELRKQSPKIYKCQFCEYSSKYKHVLKFHINYKHSENPTWYLCSSCNYKTKHKSSLLYHFKMYHDENSKMHHCQFCEYKSKDMGTFQRHVEYNHNENAKWFQCSSCIYKTKYKSALMSHFKMKHDDNPEMYQCQLCEYKSKNKSSLRKHIKFVKHMY